MTKSFTLRKSLTLVLSSLAVAAVLGFSSQAQANDRSHYHARNRSSHHGHSHFGGRSGPIYHAPSVHFDSYYHHDYTHWTPGRGLHSHGHYHTVPHYTPGHFDYKHGNHIHANPWFHH